MWKKPLYEVKIKKKLTLGKSKRASPQCRESQWNICPLTKVRKLLEKNKAIEVKGSLHQLKIWQVS